PRASRPRAARDSGRGRTGSSFDLHVDEARGRLGAVERLEVRLGDRDHVAAAVAVEPDRPDRLADPEGRPGLADAGGGEDLLERADPPDAARRQRPGVGGQEADREWLLEPRHDELVPQLLPEREAELDLDEVDADRVPDEVGHLAAGDPSRTLDHRDAP